MYIYRSDTLSVKLPTDKRYIVFAARDIGNISHISATVGLNLSGNISIWKEDKLGRLFFQLNKDTWKIPGVLDYQSLPSDVNWETPVTVFYSKFVSYLSAFQPYI